MSDDTDWLQVARDAFTSSTTYADANWRKAWERNIALFQSRHPDGSKYNSDLYKKRSRLFRPKTKSVVRKNEAAAAAAFFANVDVVSVETGNDADPVQVAAAQLMSEAVNYRLTKTIPWYVTVIGAVQEAQVIGAVASYQYWKYSEKPTKSYEPLTDDLGQQLADADGNPYMQVIEGAEVIEDKPCIDLIPIDQIHFDPGASWTDVVGTSPYVIRKVPMYVDSVRQQMKAVDSKTGQQKWKTYSEDVIRAAMVDYDSIRNQREGKHQDPKAASNAPLKAFEIVWCHENFVRLEGEEVVYWTLGTQHLLTEPKPLKEVYFTGERPIVIGYAVLEAHKAMPESLVAIGSELQKEANETVNSRRDNVALVLNKRYIVKRNAQVDIDSLLRNVPGAVTMANSPKDDVQEMNWPDVTGSAYQEQDRLNVDFDELTGNFSQGSVQTNRQLNETVGGMKLMAGGANQLTEYLIRTFVETWVEPVLRQLVALEKEYETDDVVLAMAGQKANLPPQAVQQLKDVWQDHDMTVNVNVGMGATDPHAKLGKFTFAMQTYSGVMSSIPDADPEAVRREVFGLAGYKDGSRFFKRQDNPANAQMQQQMQEMGKALQELQQKSAKQELMLANKQGELQVAQFDADTKRIAATKPETPNNGPTAIDAADAQTKRIGAVSNAVMAAAQVDLLQAQTVKTLAEAAIVPSQAMAEKAANVE